MASSNYSCSKASSETFSQACSNGFWKNNAELAQEDLIAFINRFVCVHLDGRNGWRDPHTGQVVHRLEWSFEDLDSGHKITSADFYNEDSDFNKLRRDLENVERKLMKLCLMMLRYMRIS